MNENITVVSGRECGDCSMCCKIPFIPEFNKPIGIWCEHCDPGNGCKIYDRRPKRCSDFNCMYLHEPGISEIWKPNISKMVLKKDSENNNGLVVLVDPKSRNAWRKEPYYSDLTIWAEMHLANQGHVHVYIGHNLIVILPDKAIDMGVLADNEAISMSRNITSTGVEWDAVKIIIDGTSAAS